MQALCGTEEGREDDARALSQERGQIPKERFGAVLQCEGKRPFGLLSQPCFATFNFSQKLRIGDVASDSAYSHFRRMLRGVRLQHLTKGIQFMRHGRPPAAA